MFLFKNNLWGIEINFFVASCIYTTVNCCYKQTKKQNIIIKQAGLRAHIGFKRFKEKKKFTNRNRQWFHSVSCYKITVYLVYLSCTYNPKYHSIYSYRKLFMYNLLITRYATWYLFPAYEIICQCNRGLRLVFLSY